MMTIASIIVVVIVTLFAFAVGVSYGEWRARLVASEDVRKLEGAVEETHKALKAAEVDQEIVRSLRAGDIGLDDLHEAGFDNVRQEATGALVAVAADPHADSEYMPFTPLPYDRAVEKIGDMVPGDEVWISLTAVRHRNDGAATLWKNTKCTPLITPETRTRLRYFDGKFELGIDPDDPTHAHGGITDATYRMEFTVVLRPEDRWPILRHDLRRP